MKILGVFKKFDNVHPLWNIFQKWLEQHDTDWVSIVEQQDQAFSIQAFAPDVIVTDQFVLDSETLKEYPTIFYLVDYLFTEPKDEIVTKLAQAQAIFTCSVYLSKQIHQSFNVAAKVCLPYGKFEPSTGKYIVYDRDHPYVSELHMHLPREEFREYFSLDDFNEAKLFLPWPKEDVFDNRICLASCKSVPVVSEQHEYADEFLQQYVTKNAQPNIWVQTIKSMLRDRTHWVNKLKTFTVRYGNAENMDDQLKKIVREKNSRNESTKRASFVEIQAIANGTVRNTVNSRRKRTPQPQVPNSNMASSIFLSGGIGDVLALESFMSDAQREMLTTICYGTNKQEFLEPIFKALPNYPNLVNHQITWNDFRNFWCFLRKGECNQRLSDDQRTPEFNAAEDWGIVVKFPQIKSGKLRYTYSSLIKHKLCNIDHLPIPVNYLAISPYSSDKRLRSRDFNNEDWASVNYYLSRKNMIGVVLNNGNEYVPSNPCLIDLSNKTSFVESVEVLKKSKGFIGIDSSLSVLAAKLFDYPELMIKTQSSHCQSNKTVYYAPRTKFQFLNTSIARLIPKG